MSALDRRGSVWPRISCLTCEFRLGLCFESHSCSPATSPAWRSLGKLLWSWVLQHGGTANATCRCAVLRTGWSRYRPPSLGCHVRAFGPAHESPHGDGFSFTEETKLQIALCWSSVGHGWARHSLQPLPLPLSAICGELALVVCPGNMVGIAGLLGLLPAILWHAMLWDNGWSRYRPWPPCPGLRVCT
jgi:hypothetical protein